ncbi:hypothetical protein JCM17380_47460 [Desulfosporosinus burensis]
MCSANLHPQTLAVPEALSRMRFNAGQTWEADRILKELPEDLEAHKSGEWIVMDLSKASEFFGITFSKFGGIISFFKG